VKLQSLVICTTMAILSAGMIYGQAPGSPAGGAVTDPTIDTTGAPAILKMFPKPAPEPFAKITAKQRLGYYAGTTFAPGVMFASVVGAGISQGINSPEEWGQGWDAYGKRLASSYGSTVIANTIQVGTAAAFHDDNRYFRAKGRSFAARMGNVIISPLVAHNDRGGARFSTSGFIGAASYTAIPLAWSPKSWRDSSSISINALIWYGSVAGTNFIREFFPDLLKKYKK
jgi:hypothetical protein